MADELEQMLDMIISGNIEGVKATIAFNDLFVQWNASKTDDRFGLHASAVLAPETGQNRFCYREQVLNKFFKPTPQHIPTARLRVFLEGWYVHTKWQTLFRRGGIAIEIEQTRVDPIWQLYHTPDAIIKLLDKKWVVEIKSMRESVFDRQLKDGKPPTNAVNQAQLYMYLTGINQAIVLAENKNTQDFALWPVYFDEKYVEPFIHRLNNLKSLFEVYRTEGKLPKRTCKSERDGRSKECPMKNACFVLPQFRDQYRRDDAEVLHHETAAQQNSSPMHGDTDAA